MPRTSSPRLRGETRSPNRSPAKTTDRSARCPQFRRARWRNRARPPRAGAVPSRRRRTCAPRPASRTPSRNCLREVRRASFRHRGPAPPPQGRCCPHTGRRRIREASCRCRPPNRRASGCPPRSSSRDGICPLPQKTRQLSRAPRHRLSRRRRRADGFCRPRGLRQGCRGWRRA